MLDQTCNGWTNYETWNVNLWLDNDGYFEGNPSPSASEIKDYVEEIRPETGASMFTDLLTAAIGAVNWHEISEHHKED